MEGFDFHSLLRKDLQALCKLNKIPANITNVAMADSLQSLPQVEGLDELIQTLSSNPQTVPGTPAVSQSARRGSVRRNATAVVEPETLTRTRRTAAKKVAPQTPATAVSRRKVSVAETSKFDLEAGEEVSSVQTAYSTRRSVRLLGKSMGKVCLKETDVQQIESAAAGGDSSFDDSCRNLDSSMEKETDGSNSSIKEISDETNDSLMKNETENANDGSNSLNVVLSLDSEDGKDKLEEQVAADVNDVTDENMVESSNPDAENIDSDAEKETGSYPSESLSSDERLTVEQQESIVETEPAVLTPPITRPALRSIVVMGSNSHHLHSPAPQVAQDSSTAGDTDAEPESDEKVSEGNVEDDNTEAANQLQAPALQVIEDGSAAADAEPKSDEKTSEGDAEDDDMEEVSSSAANQLQNPAPQVTEDTDTEAESDEKTSEGDDEDDNMEEVSSFAADQLQTPAPQVTEDSPAAAAAAAEPESDEKTSEDDNMEEVVPSARSEDINKEGALSEFVIKEDTVDEMSVSQVARSEDVLSENVVNKENIKKKKEELVELSMRQLTKMLKEKLQIKEGGKTEKRQALAENTNKGC